MLMNLMKFFPLCDSEMIAILCVDDSHIDLMMMEMWYLMVNLS